MMPKIKPLVWNESKAPVAQSCVGVYLMSHDFDGWYWILTQQGQIVEMARKPFLTLHDAQAAAQADYAARIIAALDPAWLAALEAQVKAADGLATMLENCLLVMQTPDQQMCCDGRECGCQGATVYQEADHYARQELAIFRAAKGASHE